MEPFRHHVIVCTQQKSENVPCCAASGAFSILDAVYAEVGKAGLSDEVIISTCGCLGLCESGPVMIVYPEATWYAKLTRDDVKEIVTSHLGEGKPVMGLVRNDYVKMRDEILEHRKGYFAMLAGKDAAGVFPDDLHETIRGFMASRVILTGVELDVFTAIGEGATADELAKKLDTDARATELLLNALVSLGILQKSDDKFHNSERAARFLAEGTRDSARQGQLHTAGMWRRWSHLTEAVKTGMPAPRDCDAQDVRSFIACMDVSSRARARAITQAVGVNGTRRMLDLGGGSGVYSIAFAKASPELRAEVVDLPDVVLLAEEQIKKAGLSERIATRPGDMLTVQLPSQSYDLALLSSICHMFSPEENRTLFTRAYEALAPKGRIAIADFIVDPDKTSPRSAALFALNMLVATRGGATYSEPEYEAWLKAAGFAETKRVRLPGPVNLILATKP